MKTAYRVAQRIDTEHPWVELPAEYTTLTEAQVALLEISKANRDYQYDIWKDGESILKKCYVD